MPIFLIIITDNICDYIKSQNLFSLCNKTGLGSESASMEPRSQRSPLANVRSGITHGRFLCPQLSMAINLFCICNFYFTTGLASLCFATIRSTRRMSDIFGGDGRIEWIDNLSAAVCTRLSIRLCNILGHQIRFATYLCTTRRMSDAYLMAHCICICIGLSAFGPLDFYIFPPYVCIFNALRPAASFDWFAVGVAGMAGSKIYAFFNAITQLVGPRPFRWFGGFDFDFKDPPTIHRPAIILGLNATKLVWNYLAKQIAGCCCWSLHWTADLTAFLLPFMSTNYLLFAA